MYNNKLVAVIKVNGKILKEQKDVVLLPFGSEYSISLKNLHTQRAVVSIDIDGENVTDGSRYIISPNETVEIEGFLRGNHVSHKFKFIEKTKEISNFRGDNIEDGLIKLTFQFEKPITFSITPTYSTPTYRTFEDRRQDFYTTCISQNTCTYSCNTNDNGITARGSSSDQSFNYGTVNTLEPEQHTMIFQLKGVSKNKYIEKPLVTRTKVQCENCGRKWKSSQEFCGNCGTSLRF